MRLLKKYKFGIILGLIVLIVPLYLLKLSPRARKAKLNVINSEKVEIKMDKKQVIQLMGAPDEIISHRDNQSQLETFYYVPPALASDGIFINFNKEGKVEKIVLYE